ncbi:quinolinate synthetase [Anaerocolumna jejuensis DSM 15929]|uniref:Quinolinate synthase n=1 Tax=Anaerocolumna jejuensis DSM 15929 TaxID=1121322 RepID=A0A1M6PSC2_9FIRM|nr:quinolinate synthase NadA [Anaerocolumna jejuensis]SHK10782.1 quinolinate synthetase [Anaerocolumna jejuensis DSM 15929]
MIDKIKNKIEELKKEKDIAVLAHYYTDGQIQALADYVGDSYYLSKIATEIPQQTILFCGVSFMGESAKLLNPGKTIIMPDSYADCPMAHMADIDEIEEVRKKHKDAAVVCYVNSTAEIKAHSDVCVTSANALKIVKALPNETIYFIPDGNLGRYLAGKIPEKNFILSDGFCHVHTSITRENVERAKQLHPQAIVLAHPECTWDVLEISDYIGSTSGIIEYATKSEGEVFIICTEMGVLYELELKNPQKKFYSVGHRQFCPNMKRITPEKILEQLQTMSNVVELDEEMYDKANRPLERMLTMSK